MPRLPIWILGATLASGSSYMAYRDYYVPSIEAQTKLDRVVEQGQREHRLAIQQLGLLRQTAESARQRYESYAAPSNSSSSSTSWLTNNKEKLLFYCGIQRLRSLLLTLPTRAQTERETQAMLEELSFLERQHCGLLNFREEGLTFSQMLRCLGCYLCYVLCFRILPMMWDPRDVQSQYVFFHQVAAHLLQELEIEASMSVSDGLLQAPVDARASGLLCVTDDTPEADHPPTMRRDATRYLALNTLHWIEEVGFWACTANPLLQPCSRRDLDNAVKTTTPTTITTTKSSGTAAVLVCKYPLSMITRCSMSSFLAHLPFDFTLSDGVHLMQRGFVAHTALQACAMPYEELWRRAFERERRRRMDTLSNAQQKYTEAYGVGSGDDYTCDPVDPHNSNNNNKQNDERSALAALHLTTTSTLGYPLASDLCQVRRALAGRGATTTTSTSTSTSTSTAAATAICAAAATPLAAGEAPDSDSPDGGVCVSAVPQFIPVAVAGLPRVLYVHRSLAKEDVVHYRGRSDNGGSGVYHGGVYNSVFNAQFPSHEVSPPSYCADYDAYDKRDADCLHSYRLVEWLRSAQREVGICCWSPVWWGGVYGGGSTRSGGLTQRRLHYHVGKASSPSEFTAEMIESSRRAVESAYS